ncbi:MAG: segregation and condensation protein [Patescibacteria group bacterium]|nr:segregation and condensation protein [Patescibacteria group bacterium]
MDLDQFLTLNKIEDFTIRQGRYEGPYTKLLDMIESRKLSISEISLSQIADEYISYIKGLEYINPLDMSQFVQVASTLMLIKAKSLLPSIEYNEEEKDQIDKLEKKLELLKELRIAEKNIQESFGIHPIYNKKKEKIKRVEDMVYDKPASLTSENIVAIALLTLAKMPNFERLKQVAVRQAIRIEKVIERIMEHINQGIDSLKGFAQNFSDGADQKTIKKNIIVSFLAILELLKSGMIDAFEKDGDITVVKK